MKQSDIELVLAESSKAIDRQAAKLDNLRSQASALVSLGAVAVGLFISSRVSGSHFSCLTWLGLAAFIVLVLSGLWILWPRQGWLFNQSATGLFKLAEMKRNTRSWSIAAHLATDLEKSYDINDTRLNRLFFLYSIGLVALLLVVVFLTIDAAVG